MIQNNSSLFYMVSILGDNYGIYFIKTQGIELQQ